MRAAILLFAHGSRDPAWARPFHELRNLLRSRLPDQQIEIGFLESMTPDFDEALLNIARLGPAVVTIAPLFLAPGGHLRADMPKLIAAGVARHPELEFRRLPSLGDSRDVLNAVADWIALAQAKDPR